jgi:hypothetical protein
MLGSRTFRFGRAQAVAASLLFALLLQCIWIVHRQQLSEADYRFARCGREMWERPSPLAGYFTTCGNLQDGTLAYRVAALPLTVERFALTFTDLFRSPENRLYAPATSGTIWESRHQLLGVKYLLHLPFIAFALLLAAQIWWVTRRLYSDAAAAFALALFCFCPAVLAMATVPNNDILAAWGLYAAIYAAMGVAHALQGPRSKWTPRILLLTTAIGLTGCAHLSAAIAALAWSAVFLLYLAGRRRSQTIPILIYAVFGTLVLLFCTYSLRPEPFSYVFTGGAALVWFSLDAPRHLFASLAFAPITIAACISLILMLATRRSRYFGNTAPLLVALTLLPLITTQSIIAARPSLWALPFLLTFIAGVFADAFETRHRRLYLALAAAIIATQALLSFSSLATLAS